MCFVGDCYSLPSVVVDLGGFRIVSVAALMVVRGGRFG